MMSKKEEIKRVWEGTYFSLFSDGTIGCSDGVGFIGCLDREEVTDLYRALRNLLEEKK